MQPVVAWCLSAPLSAAVCWWRAPRSPVVQLPRFHPLLRRKRRGTKRQAMRRQADSCKNAACSCRLPSVCHSKAPMPVHPFRQAVPSSTFHFLCSDCLSSRRLPCRGSSFVSQLSEPQWGVVVQMQRTGRRRSRSRPPARRLSSIASEAGFLSPVKSCAFEHVPCSCIDMPAGNQSMQHRMRKATVRRLKKEDYGADTPVSKSQRQPRKSDRTRPRFLRAKVRRLYWILCNAAQRGRHGKTSVTFIGKACTARQ